MKLIAKHFVGYFFILPAILTLMFLLLLPMAQGIALSFFKGDLADFYKTFVGFGNYKELFTNERTINSIERSVIFTLATVIGVFFSGMIFALALNCNIRFRKAARTLLLLPWVISGVVAGLTWRWILNIQYGVLNDILLRLHLISKAISWLGDPNLAFLSVIIATIWRSFPFVMLMLLAGMQAIDATQYESAALDGAGPIQRFWRITLPNLSPVLFPVILTQIIWQLNSYDLIATMSGLGPINSTETLPLNIYTNAFIYFKINYAASVGAMLLLFTLIFSSIYIYRYLKVQ